MGSDDSFNKRKARSAADLKRKSRDRARNSRYLIVCEGTKTEPNYLKEMLIDLRIRPQVIRVAPNDGVTPDRVVTHALALYEEEEPSGDTYDKVYCVFDRDRHTTFDAAVQRIKDLGDSGKPFIAITSTPCFEVWLLLHFRYSDKPFHSSGKKSVGDQVVSSLKTMPGFAKYDKGQKGIYLQLKNKLGTAVSNAKLLRQHSTKTGSKNPFTEFDSLVEAIQELARN